MNNPFYTESDCLRLHQSNHQRDPQDIRTEFQHDRDRIIHSEPFRRLQNKTQVLFPGEYDFYRTRLTHSIETAQIGRTIAYHLNNKDDQLIQNDYKIDYDLIEAICLSHDIGHSPFGHLGERVLNFIMDGPGKKAIANYLTDQYKDIIDAVKKDVNKHKDTGFEGNAQNLRLIESIAHSKGKEGRYGFNPTTAMWQGLIKYPVTASHANGSKFIYNSTFETYSDDQKKMFNHSKAVYQDYNFFSLENQIMNMADDISYSVLDVEDAFNSKFLNLSHLEQIEDYIKAFNKKHKSAIDSKELMDIFKESLKSKESIRQFKRRFFTRFVNDLKLVKRKNMSEHTGTERSARFDFNLVFNDESNVYLIKLFKYLVKKFVFTTPHIKQLQHSVPFYIFKLFQAYYFHEELLPMETQSELPENLSTKRLKQIEANGSVLWSKSRIICDHIAGMTDPYFLKQYNKLFKAGESHLLDIL